ncbi:MAG: LEA type 2 family protein [Leptospira sp.]|nr:LEA type 2 family protein [Leptospira sp.]NCS92832.1 LEA type 2 family protein [Leptospira sp.]
MKLLNQKHKIEKFTLMFVIGLALQTCIFSDIKNVEDLKKCEIDFNSISVKNYQTSGLFSLTPKLALDTEVSFYNPNESEVKIYSFDLDISLLNEGREDKLGKILSEQEITVPSKTTIQIPLKINSEFDERLDAKLLRIALKLLGDLKDSKETEFLIKGNVKYRTLFGNIDIPVNEIQKAKLRGSSNK